MDEVQTLMDRAPDRSHSYESGKRWIPFYFGNDARRLQALYKGEGCLIFTGVTLGQRRWRPHRHPPRRHGRLRQPGGAPLSAAA